MRPMEGFEKMVLPISDKTEDIEIGDLVEFARNLDIPEDIATETARELAHGIADRARELINNIPDIIKAQPKVFENVQTAMVRAVERSHAMFPDVDPEIIIDESLSKNKKNRMARP